MIETAGWGESVGIALRFVPARAFPVMSALFALDATLGRAVAAARDPIIGQIRLAWWRDALTRLGTGPQEDPTLVALTASLPAHDLTGESLLPLVDGWEAVLAPLPLEISELENYAKGRGTTLFTAAATVMRTQSGPASGKSWALYDFARNCSDLETARRAMTLADRCYVTEQRDRAKPLRVLTRLLHDDARRAAGTARSRWALLRATFA